MLASPALRSRPIWVPASAILVVAVILYSRFLPHVFAIYGQGDSILPIHPTQYLPIVLALVLSTSLAPRFRLWDQLGTSRISELSLVYAAIVVLIPPLLAWSFPLTSDFPLAYTRAISANVFFLACLCYLAVSILGRLWGSLLAGLATWGIYTFAAGVHWFTMLGPLSMVLDQFAESASAAVLTDLRWPWLVAIALLVFAQAWFRRGLPIESISRVDRE